MLLWASKFATATIIIECGFEMGKKTPLGGTIYFAGDGTMPVISVILFLNILWRE